MRTASYLARRLVPGLDSLMEQPTPDTTTDAPCPERVRPVIESVSPTVDGGRFAAKREVGDLVSIEADMFAEGHDQLACELQWRHQSDSRWLRAFMDPLGNDRFGATFTPDRMGTYWFSLRAWIDTYGTWVRDLRIRVDAGQDVSVELLVGAQIIDSLAERATKADRAFFIDVGQRLKASTPVSTAGTLALVELATDPEVLNAARRYPEPGSSAVSDTYPLTVDRTKARFSTWYEMFPRSSANEPGVHGTLRDVERQLPYVSKLGFDVLYLPPIHPIGRTNRKGRDGAIRAEPSEPGSPWAIGSSEGGHTAIDPQLGTSADLDRLVKAANALDIEIALDLALQCAPDHPWVTDHPAWFQTLPDGTIRYAENPPKRYEDIYPINFDNPDWRALWDEIASVVRFWMSHGVRIFRVDNPHTKPFAFWEWLISTIKSEDPDVLFLSEAFTRPKVMNRLAKLGFTQSYTYVAWRYAKWELEQYLTELHSAPVADFLRPNLWPNTPDILTEQLQTGGKAAFMSRFVLAATLASSYGIYGPPFELQESRPRSPGSEEYLHSEKYEIRNWDREDPLSLRPFISLVNRARKENPALQTDRNLLFHRVDNDNLIAYSRQAPDSQIPRSTAIASTSAPNTVLVVVNLDPVYTQSGWVDIDLGALGIADNEPFVVRDVLTGASYTWMGRRNFVSLDPRGVPAHVLIVDRLS
ncbi:MAG: alpha-1,4-glucan--maltose-1-phosphate maltosyltransferase [Acidimicrobiales bacterium]